MEPDATIIADVHGNQPALDAVLGDRPDSTQLLCAGDVVGILGSNEYAVETVRDEADAVVFGNHDARIRSDFAYTPSFQAAVDEMRVVSEQLDEEHVDWIASLPDRIETDEYVLAHSRPFYFRDPGYPCHGFAQGDRGIEPKDFTRVGPHLDGKTALLGHTHEQHAVDCSKFEGQSGLVLNPGSVGVPWYGDAEYAVVDFDTHEYDLRSVEYDTELVEQQLEAQGTPVGTYSSDRIRR